MIFSDLILNDLSKKNLQNYLEKTTHALLLTGKSGVGLNTIAEVLAREIANANFIRIYPQLHKKQKAPNINIDDIRELHEITRSVRKDKIVIIIDEAEKMTHDAPQTLLKLLEEPAENVFYILTSHLPEKLPKTIHSRSQKIEILPAKNSAEFILPNFTKLTNVKIAQIKFIAGNFPAEIHRLLANEEYFRDTAAKIETAKIFLQGNIAARLKIISNVNNREDAKELIANLARLINLTMNRVSSEKLENVAQNLQILSAATDNLSDNCNLRAQLTAVAINFY